MFFDDLNAGLKRSQLQPIYIRDNLILIDIRREINHPVFKTIKHLSIFFVFQQLSFFTEFDACCFSKISLI